MGAVDVLMCLVLLKLYITDLSVWYDVMSSKAYGNNDIIIWSRKLAADENQ